MTIKEAAKAYGVSTQAIYKRLQTVGKKAQDVTNRANGELTDNGAELLATWFDNLDNQTNQKPTNRNNGCKELEAALATLQAENKALKEQVATLQTDKDRLYTLLNQAQQTAQALTLARIGSGTEKKRPIWERMKVFVLGEKDANIQN